MTIAWTEACSSFTPAGTGWQDYDLYTNQGVPKGAVAYILCLHANSSATRSIGVRTDGSSLARYISIHAAANGGNNGIGMYVTCHSTTGLIETYCSATANVTFILLGYWTDITFTEKFASISSGSGVWANYDLYTNQSVPKGAVAQVACMSYRTTVEWLGVRTDSSSLARYQRMSISDGTAHNGHSMCVKCHASTGLIEIQYPDYGHYWLLGYFATDLDYQELYVITADATTSNSTWTDYDVTSSLDQDGRVVESFICHHSTGAEVTIGIRSNGSALARYYTEHEAATDGEAGQTFPTQTDANGIIEVYSSAASSEYCGLWGYFKFTASTLTSITVSDSIGLADITALGKSITVTESIGAIDLTPMSKTMNVADTLSLSDVSKFIKTLQVTEGITATDSVKLIKTLLAADAIHATDAVALTKILKVAEALQVTDSAKLIKFITSTDVIGLSDATLLSKFIAKLCEDSIGLSDSVKTVKSLLVNDTVSASDLPKLVKSIVILDSIGSLDTVLVTKLLKVAESTHFSDATKMTKSMKLADVVSLADASKMSKSMRLADSIALNDASKLIKSMFVAEGISASDATVLSKSLVVADALGLSDSVTVTLLGSAVSWIVTDTISVVDSVKFVKLMKAVDSLGITDAIKFSKALIQADAIAFDESDKLNKSIRIDDSLLLSESIKLAKSIVQTDQISVNDVESLIKAIKVADSIELTDEATQALIYILTLRLTKLQGIVKANSKQGTIEEQTGSGTTSQSSEGDMSDTELDGMIHINSLEG